jgi:hypothetical protein
VIVPVDVESVRYGDEYADRESLQPERKKLSQVVNDYCAEPPSVFRCTEHVKNGKPLTAIGAKLLGVPWNGGER